MGELSQSAIFAPTSQLEALFNVLPPLPKTLQELVHYNNILLEYIPRINEESTELALEAGVLGKEEAEKAKRGDVGLWWKSPGAGVTAEARLFEDFIKGLYILLEIEVRRGEEAKRREELLNQKVLDLQTKAAGLQDALAKAKEDAEMTRRIEDTLKQEVSSLQTVVAGLKEVTRPWEL
jgi:hypothetical protein